MSLLLYVRSPSEIPFGINIFDVFIRYWRPLLFLLFQQDFFTTTEKKLRTEVDWAPLQSEYERTTWNSKRLSITLKMWSCENHTTTIKITIHKCHISIYIYICLLLCRLLLFSISLHVFCAKISLFLFIAWTQSSHWTLLWSCCCLSRVDGLR